MTPYRQIMGHGGGQIGDCYRMCIASLLDTPPERVPHFTAIAIERGQVESRVAREWLEARGLTLIELPFAGDWTCEALLQYVSHYSPGAHFVLSGRTAVGPNHSVVAGEGKILHNPSGVPLTGPCDGEFWWVGFIGKKV